MSLVAMNRIWDQSTQTGTPLVILLALADRADEDGICWPGVDWIAQRARLQPRQARNVLRSLEESGDIIIATSKGGRNLTNRYLITAGLDSDKIAAIVARRPDVFPHGHAQKPCNPAQKPCNFETETLQSSVNKPCNFETETLQSGAETLQSSVKNPATAIAGEPVEPLKQPPIKLPVVAVVADTTTAAAAAIPAQSDKDRKTDPEWATICVTYENEIGLLTPTIADQLADLTTTYPARWIVDAITEAARANVRKLNYTIAILRRWHTEGKTANANPDTNRPAHRGPNPPTKPADPAPENIYNQLLGWTTT